ncbi:DUF4259 domain-containing protein [Microbulbifer sp. 2304DJ12-6]|uniref:DUF4259 domain-containing protein n=1 Tax=Microbulbifer sp. 2304DJ12-6 TaxID=3233340 RepID=UPI0039AF6DD3
MGAWAEDAFGNDTACDWAGDFSENPSLEVVKEAINSVIATADYLDSDEACEGLVACEIVARLKGNWGEKSVYSEEIDKWVESTNVEPSKELVAAAEKAIVRILGSDSELQELWDEDGKSEKWHSEMNNLLERVKS